MTSGVTPQSPPMSPTDPNLAWEFQQSPGYQYQFQQMMDATQNSAAGKTGAISGNMLRALQQNAGGLANQDYYNFYDRMRTNWQDRYTMLQNLISGGQGAAGNLGTFGQQSVSNIGGLLGNLGSAQALGTIGASNALAGGFSGLGSALATMFGGGGNNNSQPAYGGGVTY